MLIRILMSGCLCVLPLVACAPRQAGGEAEARVPRFEYRQRHMGVVARIVLHAPNEPAAREAAAAAFARIAELDSLMSDYRADSELSGLNQRAGGPPVEVSAELFHVLAEAQRFARLSDGAFDVTVGPYVGLWREARRTGQLPSTDHLRAATGRVGWQKLNLDAAARTAQLLVPGMQLDLGAIAKGYAADEALAVLRSRGLGRALVELGGDLVLGDPPPDGRGWRVAIPAASEPLLLANVAVASSGDTEQYVEISGVRYSHVVDPRTGLGLTQRTSATVVAPDALTADALATLLGVLGPERGQAFLREHAPGARAFFR